MQIAIRSLQPHDVPRIVATKGGAAWNGGSEKWKRYSAEHAQGQRLVLLAEVTTRLVGYGSLLLLSQHPPFRDAGVPEIQDLVVAEEQRHQGIGTQIIHGLEELAKSRGYPHVGIGVGLYRDYGSAQRLYVQRGYIPDGRGISYRNNSVEPGSTVRVDDDLLLWLVKSL